MTSFNGSLRFVALENSAINCTAHDTLLQLRSHYDWIENSRRVKLKLKCETDYKGFYRAVATIDLPIVLIGNGWSKPKRFICRPISCDTRHHLRSHSGVQCA